MCPLPPKLSSHPHFKNSYNIYLFSVLDCFYPNAIWWLTGQFCRHSTPERKTIPWVRRKSRHSASLCWAVPGLAQNRGSSRGALWVLLLWNELCLWAPAVPSWCLQPASPLSLLPGPVGGIRVSVSSLRAGSCGLCLGDRVRFRVLWDQYR